MLKKLERVLGLKTNPVIFFSAAFLTLVFVVVSIVFTEQVDWAFGAASESVMRNLGWFYILGVTSFLGFLLWIAFSRFGHVRLGGKDERPEYSNVTWFGMLFAAGIGTILMFWGGRRADQPLREPTAERSSRRGRRTRGRNAEP